MPAEETRQFVTEVGTKAVDIALISLYWKIGTTISRNIEAAEWRWHFGWLVLFIRQNTTWPSWLALTLCDLITSSFSDRSKHLHMVRILG